MTAKQYLIDNGLADSHWGKRIIEAEERGRFMAADEDLAGSWVTCACGKLEGIERTEGGCPKDGALARMGRRFEGYVLADSFDRAARALVAIERRAAELLSPTRSTP